MPTIPTTEQKLQEARFHLGLLSNSDDPAIQRHHLSAFLSAGRTVTWALQNEAKAEYDVWFTSWFGALAADDQALMDYMKLQRNAELKKAGEGKLSFPGNTD